jgi:hypothetical protein
VAQESADVRRDVPTPSPTGYGATLRIERNGTIAPVAIPDVVVAVDNFLPPA